MLSLSSPAVNKMLRLIAVKAASKPLVEITQDGETLSIKTSTTVRTTHITFTVGQEFNEATVDGRPCTVHAHTYAHNKWVFGEGTAQITSICLIWLFIIF